jgi:S-formylglutathione hydrolase FrmB
MYYAACQALGVRAEYYEEDNTHDWFFWDAMLKRFLAAELEPASTN